MQLLNNKKHLQKAAFVYLVTNVFNGKKYVGFTTQTVQQRWEQHVGVPRLAARQLHKAVVEWGEICFIVETIFEGTVDQALKAEVKFIKKYGTFGSEGYNRSPGGETWFLGCKHTLETREKLSRLMKGRKHSQETRNKIGIASRGRKPTPETKAKMSESAILRMSSSEARAKLRESTLHQMSSPEARAHMSIVMKGNKNGVGNKGHQVSDQTRAKISLANKGRVLSLEHRAKIGAVHKGNKYRLGHKSTPETKAKISVALKGYKHSLETRRRMGEAQKISQNTAKAKARKSKVHKGKIISDVQKEKLRIASLAMWTDPEIRKRILQGRGLLF